ncbi:hypothetical protein evm_005080 [Chilo suppressalis]|nr:hypothetical protein evm_005080 [Chilo suppressalis]
MKSIFITSKGLLKQTSFLRIVSRNAVNLSYKILGDEDLSDPDIAPLFILHGLLGMKKHWESLGKTMLSTTKRNAVVVDLRNHGDSPHVNSHKYQELAEDMIQLLDKLSVKRAYLVGHSMGGKTCMCISLMAPHRVAGLLVLDISPASAPYNILEYMPKVLNLMKAVEFKTNDIRSSRKQVKRALDDIVTEETFMKAIISNIRVKNGVVGWACNLNTLIKHYKYISSFPREMLGKKYRGPTLFLGGQLSDYIPPDDLPKIKAYFPLAVIQYIPKTGHFLHVDDPRAFLEYVISFSRSLEGD